MDSSEQIKKYRIEIYSFLALTTFVGLIIYSILEQYRTEKDIRATSIEKEVMVTGKRKGGGKTPNMVYIQDGIIPIGVSAQTRWYWECKIGSTTKVRFSLKHHAYQDPYRKSERHIYFACFFGLIIVFMVGRMIWLVGEISKEHETAN